MKMNQEQERTVIQNQLIASLKRRLLPSRPLLSHRGEAQSLVMIHLRDLRRVGLPPRREYTLMERKGHLKAYAVPQSAYAGSCQGRHPLLLRRVGSLLIGPLATRLAHAPTNSISPALTRDSHCPW